MDKYEHLLYQPRFNHNMARDVGNLVRAGICLSYSRLVDHYYDNEHILSQVVRAIGEIEPDAQILSQIAQSSKYSGTVRKEAIYGSNPTIKTSGGMRYLDSTRKATTAVFGYEIIALAKRGVLLTEKISQSKYHFYFLIGLQHVCPSTYPLYLNTVKGVAQRNVLDLRTSAPNRVNASCVLKLWGADKIRYSKDDVSDEVRAYSFWVDEDVARLTSLLKSTSQTDAAQIIAKALAQLAPQEAANLATSTKIPVLRRCFLVQEISSPNLLKEVFQQTRSDILQSIIADKLGKTGIIVCDNPDPNSRLGRSIIEVIGQYDMGYLYSAADKADNGATLYSIGQAFHLTGLNHLAINCWYIAMEKFQCKDSALKLLLYSSTYRTTAMRSLFNRYGRSILRMLSPEHLRNEHVLDWLITVFV